MKGKSLKALIVSLIAAMLIFIPILGTSQNVEAAVKEKLGVVGSETTSNGVSATNNQTLGKNYNVKINVAYRQTVARSMKDVLNNWRAGSNWYYSPQNTKLYKSNLKPLVYDYKLEEYAMQRAAEIVLHFAHTRPKGDAKTGITGYMNFGENLAASTNVKASTPEYAMTMFKEENKPYDQQGHRRMMLSVPAAWDAVGIACVYYNGCYYWVQTFGVTSSPNTIKTPAVDGNKTMNIEVNPSTLQSKNEDFSCVQNWSGKFEGTGSDHLPNVKIDLFSTETWPHQSTTVDVVSQWSSSNKSVATVDSDKGIIKCLNAGTTNLTVKNPITGQSKTKKFEVEPIPATSISLDKKTITIDKGTTYKLKATILPTNATNKTITWTSSNNAIATVDKNGTITGINAGTATITAKTVNGKTATCKVTVKEILPISVKLNKTATNININKSEKLTATVEPSNATNKTITWTSSNNAIATVDKNGTVTGIKAGTSTITAKTVNGKTATCKVTVDGWVNNNGKYSYLKSGKKLVGWYRFTSKEGEKTDHWSYFDKNGFLLTGWVQFGKGTANPDGNKAVHWSYFGDNGWLRTGWQQMGKGTNNSFNENTNKHWSYFGENGWLRTEWQQMGKGTANSFDENTNKHWSYFGGNGWLRTGKQTINNKMYTFNGNGWLTNPSKP